MTNQVQALAEKMEAFNREMIAFIQSVPDDKWHTICDSEQWPIGVVARHVGAAHYSVTALAKMMIAKAPLPDFSKTQIDEMNRAHATKHTDCTKEEVLSVLDNKGRQLVDYISGLWDDDLQASANIPEIGSEINVRQLFERLVLESGGEHLTSMRRTLGTA